MWKQEEIQKLKECIEAGMNYDKIAEILKKTKKSITGKTNKLKLRYSGKPPIWTVQQELALQEFVKAGYKDDYIAKTLQKTRGAVLNKIKRLNIEYSGHFSFWTHEEEIRLGELLKQQLTYLEISKILNKSKNSVIGKANRLKLNYGTIKKKKEPKVIIKKEPYIPRMLPEAPQSLKLTIGELEKHNCRYIEGNDRLFCGHKTVEKSPYCQFHKEICYSILPPNAKG